MEIASPGKTADLNKAQFVVYPAADRFSSRPFVLPDLFSRD